MNVSRHPGAGRALNRQTVAQAFDEIRLLGAATPGSRGYPTRRAVGACRRDIVTHFMVENAIVLTAGALLGSLLALAIADWLTVRYSLPRLDLAYLLMGVVLLWIVGELAAWQPALRAASIPPSVATRTV